MKIFDVCQEFLKYTQIIKNQSGYTRRNYQHYLGRFISYSRNMNIEELGLAEVYGYRGFLQSMGLGNDTQNYHLFALRSLLSFCKKMGISTLEPSQIEVPKPSPKQIEIVTEDEVEKIIHAIEVDCLQGVRDKAILSLLACSGIRVGELVQINKTSIDLQKGSFNIVGKGSKPRLIFINEKTSRLISMYLDLRHDDYLPLFVNTARANSKKIDIEERRRLTVTSVQNIVRSAALKANITKKVTPHSLRHSWAVSLLNSGVDIRTIQVMLGHSSIETTMRYLQLSDVHLKKAYEKAFSN